MISPNQGESLTPERFARVREIFEAAAERPAAERRAFAAGACADDQALLREVERMLAGDEETRALLDEKPSSASATEEGRFPAGTVLGERYRILGLLGRGGMGEVYRAFDLKLDQVVALKFLPSSNSARRLERFRGEVRMARQVSHRNVCRVHDIGEVDGLAFLSMEYIDGDTLGTLLQQVGRLQQDKALEFSRRLCAGLAAAHERGVLHRDLKPANIMIDRRGQLLITDFGLAAAADAIPGTDIRSGTPAYMSPEQKEGKEVTVRSDIYSLGLVLAEMFTGQKDAKTSATKGLDPAIDLVIQRCLDPDPGKRPDSALTVARMLPGGDPLAEAMAAGETPTPGMVAASEDTGTLSIKWAVACLIFILAGLAVVPVLAGEASILSRTPFDNPPAMMADKARAMAARLGIAKKPLAETFDYRLSGPTRLWAVEKLSPETYRDQLKTAQPGEAFFVLEQRFTIRPTRKLGIPAYDDTLFMVLDQKARLVALARQLPDDPPPAKSNAAPARAMDWNMVAEMAGVDSGDWTLTEGGIPPSVRFDERRTWVGRYPGIPKDVTIDAASWQGELVYFDRQGPWFTEPLNTRPPRFLVRLRQGFTTILFLAVVVLTWRSYRSGGADLPSLARLAGFVGIARFFAELLRPASALHVPAANFVFGTVPSEPARIALQIAAQIALIAYAVEPFVRRQWPQLLISWTRFLRGEIRSPLVGAHVLVGVALGVGLGVVVNGIGVIAIRPDTPILFANQMDSLTITGAVSLLLERISNAPLFPLTLLLSFVLFRALLRSEWVAGVLTTAGIALQLGLGSPAPIPIYTASVIQAGLMFLILVRFGVLPLLVGFSVSEALNRFPLTSDLSTWYAVYGLIPWMLILALAVWSFRNTLGRRPLFAAGSAV